MAENEEVNRQLQQQAAERAQAREAETIRRCKHCGTDLEEDSLFCPQCGEQFGGEEHTCQICNTKTTQEFCPHCGRRLIPLTCPHCGTPSFFDACENCGTLLNQELAAFLTEEKTEPQAMSEEEARKIEEAFEQQPLAPEFDKFQKRLIERQILLEERDYFKNREKRIIKVFGVQPFSLELPDPEEEAFRAKAYAALEKTVIERQEKMLREEWERRFPGEKLEEIQPPTPEEMERRYQELLSQVENEVEAHRIAEERRKAEEEERRRKEEERRRLEQEMFERRCQGSWYYTYGCLTIKIIIDSQKTAICIYTCTVCGGSRIQYNVEFDGSNIKLSARSRTGSRCTYGQYPQMDRFSGVINTNGTIMTGYLSGGYSVEFHKY